MRLVILEAESLGKDMDLSGFSRFGEVTVYEKTTEEECPERVREADIVICNKVRMCSRTLSGAENLKLICVTATGINNIDLDYVKRHNIAVTNVAGYSTVSVAQHRRWQESFPKGCELIPAQELCDVLLSGRKTPLLR